MAEPYVGQIMLAAFNYVPLGWAFCNGGQASIKQYGMLFQAIGTKFGGDGTSYFNFPDLRGRVVVHQGQGTGLGSYPFAAVGGQDMILLTSGNLPQHTHPVNCNTTISDQGSPAGNIWGPETTGQTATYATGPANVIMTQSGMAGSLEPHDNHQPYLVLYFLIAANGGFPTAGTSLDGGGMTTT